jgi:hypothetical protein
MRTRNWGKLYLFVVRMGLLFKIEHAIDRYRNVMNGKCTTLIF